ncbi:unnamed protein product [Alopecurus aequalis]
MRKTKVASEEPPPSSSMDSCGVDEAPAVMISTASSCHRPPISTDLHLGLSLRSSLPFIHTAHNSSPSTPRSALTTTTTATVDVPVYELRDGGGHGRQSMFVKVYMEGVPIGRKLDLLLLDGYDGLLDLLGRMFKASIIYPDAVGGDHDQVAVPGDKQGRHVLTYQDHEGDWLVAGDVPWELFVEGVKKLRIACADSCFH